MQLQLQWNGPCYGTTGYAKNGRVLLLALREVGIDLQLKSTDFKIKRIKYNNSYKKLLSIEKNSNNESEFEVFYNIPTSFSPVIDKWNIGITYWETTRVPIDWVESCNKMNHLILFSDVNRQAFRESGVTIPIDVIPCPIGTCDHDQINDIETFKRSIVNNEEELSLLNKNLFTFLSISSWIPRKGFDILLQAYYEEFTSKDEVLLIIKTKRNRCTSVKKIYQKVYQSFTNNSAPILLHVGDLTDNEMNLLYLLCDAYVLPSRGEGIGLPFLEAGIRGLPVITTGWGGQLDFLNKENSYLIDYVLEPAYRSPCSRYYKSDQLWARPDKEHLKYLMRLVYNERKEAIKKGAILKEYLKANHQPETVAEIFKEKVLHTNNLFK